MNSGFELLDIDRITAEMYGIILNRRDNQIPLSKNGIEPLDEFEEEIDVALDMIDYEFFGPTKEKFLGK